ncbi:lipoprotein [Arthrobacter phage Seahorse]|uniref:Band 7 domain-containing protein n=1 Tax=Arthrobacter phage Seahorse TaxID=2419611 RepID=A0A3G3M665_9CAUD|nr:lipoprotein [Arthrobacter phage Seahorse]AYR01577.1 hypothetical protein PBI_SEAHORSE_77 [Arthrobacter phage Seahorse]
MFIVAIILAALAIGAFIFGQRAEFTTGYREEPDRTPNKIAKLVALGLTALAIVALLISTVYSQDAGEAKVLKSWSGSIEGQDTTEGYSVKAPWVDAIDYDIRNQQAAYVGNGNDDYNGKKPDGPQITFTDKDGVSANADVVVRYSIRPDKVTEVFRAYGPQETFKSRLINNDIRSVVRIAPTGYSTIDVLTKRADIENAIGKALAKRWESEGVQVESVALQEIRYADNVKQRFDDAQNARTEIVKAQAELEATKISAQQKVVQAKAEADANATLAKSLTEPILKQRYIDALSKSKFMVVPEGGGNIINIPADK